MSHQGAYKKPNVILSNKLDIKKYRPVQNFGAAEWYQQLSFRNFLFSNPHEEYAFMEEAKRIWLRQLWNDPIITEDRIKALHSLKHGHDDNNDIYSEREGGGELLLQVVSLHVRPEHIARIATNAQIRVAQKYLPPEMKGPLRVLTIPGEHQMFGFSLLEMSESPVKKLTSDEAHLFRQKREEILASPFAGINSHDCGHLAFIAVNPTLALKKLCSAVETCLREMKKNTKRSGKVFLRTAHFKDWYNCGLLPYLDLFLQSKIDGDEIGWSAFMKKINHLTNMQNTNQDMLRKKVQQYADKAMHPQMCQLLKAQALIELTTKKKFDRLIVQ